MFTQFFAQGDLLTWPLVALAIFFAVFMAVLVQTFTGWRQPRALSDITSLPLASDDVASAQDSEDVSR